MHDLLVCIRSIFSTEWRPANKALEHDGTNRPPIAEIGISLTIEDLGGDIVWGAHRRVSHCATGLTPRVDLPAVRDCEVYSIVEEAGVAVFILGGGDIFQESLVVGVIVLLFTACRETEIGQFDVAATVKEDVIRFDITGELVSKEASCNGNKGSELMDITYRCKKPSLWTASRAITSSAI